MNYFFEVYLTKSFVAKDEWLELIKVISSYNGFFKKWKLIVLNDKNKVRYFIKLKCSLPATINNLSSFMLKPVSEIDRPVSKCTLISLPKLDSSFIELINYNEIKNKGVLFFLEISFRKISSDKIKSKVIYYLEKEGFIKKYLAVLAIPINILSIDFENNKRYFYKGSPNYLDISKILHLLSSDKNNALLSIDSFPYLQGEFYLKQNNFNFDKHSIILGSSGSGKSKFISLLISNIIKNERLKYKYKIVVIDPHASLENDIGGLSRVIDFKNAMDSIDLFINNEEDTIVSTELLLDLFKSLIADQYNSKLERVLRHSLHLLLAHKLFNFGNLRKLLLDLNFRNDLIRKMKNGIPISVIDFFLTDFNEMKTKYYGEAISPIISFIDEMEMIPVFNTQENFGNLKETIEDNFLILFSLDRISLGDKVTKTISGLIMQQLLTLIQRKVINEHIIFVIDEVAIIENPILSRYLSEARKYNLSLILAGQYFNQISDNLKSSIFANVINYFIFRVSKMDANLLVDNFNMKLANNDSRDKKIKLLTELNNRECVARIDCNGLLLPAFKGRTLDYVSKPRINKTIIIKNKFINNDDTKIKGKKTDFMIDNSVNLKDILIANSSSRKVEKK